ncbi:MAG TPA: adenylate/guanylate cyclase domain-containing protein [Casimicrobiaceae bacterium]|nr:adenylate/guanylate cyclase domain-containing protein [Casimicrobiaceae bacterium]
MSANVEASRAVNDETSIPATAAAAATASPARLQPYVPRALQQHLIDDPDGRSWTAEGSAAFVDVSGFTQLSEQLARKGREGAEQITDAIGGSFESILSVAYENGASLLKFGGDALLLWFDGENHATRASRAAVLMREKLDQVGRIELPDAKVTLQMTQGVHSGEFHFFAAGTSHLELLPTGPAWSQLVEIEHSAQAGEILMSDETAALLPSGCVHEARASARILREFPTDHWERLPLRPRPVIPFETLAQCLPPAIRTHVLGSHAAPEHRPVTIAFIRFAETDALIEKSGAAAASDALHRLVSSIESAAEEQGVAFLGSDIDLNGGKLILTAGAPKVTGNDEERMLLALRKIVDTDLPLPISVGVHRGAVFAGDIGPFYRRTYTVMGDAVNLAARLMAKAEPRAIYATGDVLDRSSTHFETTKLDPFTVKGKAEPIQAWSVGKAQSSKSRVVSTQRLPLTGRNAELGMIRKAFTSARSGAGRLIEVVGDSGIGKTRLLEALRDAATVLNKQHATCEAYTASTPYAVWRELLREYFNFGRDDPEEEIATRLKEEIEKQAPDLMPWRPLIGIPFGLEIEPTAEVAMIAETNRRAKLHETVAQFLAAIMPNPQLIEIENAHYMDEASAELLTSLIRKIGTHPWLFAVARQGAKGFIAPEAETVVRIELKPLAPPDTLRLAQLATQQSPLAAHVLEVVATRSGGNPQFLRDLLQRVVDSGGIADLPDSAEAATMAQIDSLSPEDRAVVRHASVFGLTFHPRMVEWFEGEEGFAAPPPAVWARISDLFDEEPDGYLRFRRSLLRDAAYGGLPFKLRRRLHSIVAARLEEEVDYPEDVATVLSLHYFEAGEHQHAWRYATMAAKRAEAAYANVEAAGLYGRALEAGRKLPDLGQRELADLHEAMADAWYRAAEFRKAGEAYAAVRPLVASDLLKDADLLIKLSLVEQKVGQYAQALRWTKQARDMLQQLQGVDAAREYARASAWQATLLQLEGRWTEAFEAAEQAATEAEAAGDPDSAGQAYFVMGRVSGELKKPEAVPLMQRSLEAFERAGNVVKQSEQLGNLGTMCHWEGRWDEALAYWERGRQAALKVGNTLFAAGTRINMADIMIDRGEWAEAEATLLETLPLWKASEYYFFLGACLFYLGRVSVRLGRCEEALRRLDEAKSNFERVGAQEEIPQIEARVAECHVAVGNVDAGLELVAGLLSRASTSTGVAKVVPLLERIRGHALLLQGDLWGAREALEASLAAAKERQDLFEVALTSLSLIELDRLEGVEPPLEMVDESRSLLASRKVRAVPPVPRPSQ